MCSYRNEIMLKQTDSLEKREEIQTEFSGLWTYPCEWKRRIYLRLFVQETKMLCRSRGGKQKDQLREALQAKDSNVTQIKAILNCV